MAELGGSRSAVFCFRGQMPLLFCEVEDIKGEQFVREDYLLLNSFNLRSFRDPLGSPLTAVVICYASQSNLSDEAFWVIV